MLKSLTNKTFYVLDFNDDLLTVNSNLTHMLAETKLPHCIDKPTRVTVPSATLLDIVTTNNCKSILYSDVVPCHITDHYIITATVHLCKSKHKPKLAITTRQLADYSPSYS